MRRVCLRALQAARAVRRTERGDAVWRPQRRSGPAHSWTCALAPSPPAPAPPAARRPPLFSMPSPIPQCDIQRGPRAAAPLRLWEAAPGSASPTSACIAALVRTLAALPPRRRRHVMPRRQHTACLSAAQGRRRHKACTKAQSQLDMSLSVRTGPADSRHPRWAERADGCRVAPCGEYNILLVLFVCLSRRVGACGAGRSLDTRGPADLAAPSRRGAMGGAWSRTWHGAADTRHAGRAGGRAGGPELQQGDAELHRPAREPQEHHAAPPPREVRAPPRLLMCGPRSWRSAPRLGAESTRSRLSQSRPAADSVSRLNHLSRLDSLCSLSRSAPPAPR